MSEKLKISLKAARVNANLSQKEVSESIRKSQGTISGYESGRVVPSVKVLFKLCSLYGVSIDDIFLPSN